MNIFDLIFEEDDNRKKPVSYVGFDEWKEKRKQSKKQETLDQSKMPKGERDWEIENALQKEKKRKEREEEWQRTAENSKIEAVSELKKTISKKGGKLRGNADLVNQEFQGKSLREAADKKKENADGKAVIFSKKELEDLIMSEDKAFIDAVSILSDLKLLHNAYHIEHSDERSSFTKEYIEWFLNSLSKGDKPETAIVNLSTVKRTDETFRKLKKEYTNAEEGFKDALKKSDALDAKKAAELKTVREKTKTEIENLGLSFEDGTEKKNFDFAKDFSLKDPKYREAFEKQIENLQPTVKNLIKTKTEALLYKEKQLIKEIEEKYEDEETRLKILRKKFIDDEQKAERKIKEYYENQQYDYYEIGPKYKELNQLILRLDAETNPAKKIEIRKRIDELSEKYNKDFNDSLNAFSARETEENELINKNRELTDQIEKALSSGQTIKAQDLKEQKKRIVARLNKIKDAKEENGAYYKFTRNGDNKYLYTIKSFKFKNVGAFLSELRNSIFLMNKDLMTTLTRIVNILYFGRDEKGDEEENYKTADPEETKKKKRQAESEARYHKNEVEIGFEEYTKAKKRKKLNELKPLIKKMLQLQKATGETINQIIKSIDASISEKKEIFGKIKQGDFGIFADDNDTKNEKADTEKINVEKLKKELQDEFDKLIVSDEEYSKAPNKEKIDKLLNKAQVQRKLSKEEEEYTKAKLEYETVDNLLNNLTSLRKTAHAIYRSNYFNFDKFIEEINETKGLKLRKFIKKYKQIMQKVPDYISFTDEQEEKNKKFISVLAFIYKSIKENKDGSVFDNSLKKEKNDFAEVFDEIDDFIVNLEGELEEVVNEKEKEFKKLPVPKKSQATRKEMMSKIIDNQSERSKLSKKIKDIKADIARTRYWNNPSYEEIKRKITKEIGKE